MPYDLNGCTVLVTGGSGSFGQAVIPSLLQRGAGRVIVYSRDELKQSDLLARFSGQPVEGFLGDVRDADRLKWACRAHVDVLIHAAALKQVPSCQYNWSEAIDTNILGSRNVVKAAIEADIPRVLALSTDKAAAPLNGYGKTKAVMEEVVTWGNAWVGSGRTRLACVRYGNVIGSRGSVVPLFQRQRISGVLTVTDPTMSRFWMRLGEAVEFVLSSVEQMAGGEVFIPKLTAASIGALARAVAPGCRQDVVGLRPGEKRHEVLISAEEAPQARDLGDRYVLYPVGATWPLEPRGAAVPTGFVYSSETAPPADLSDLEAA